MKKLSSVGCVLFLVAWWAVLAPAKSSAPKDKWEKGWVSDSKCGAKGAGVGHEQCGKKCLGEGEHVVFVNEFNHKVFNVDRSEEHTSELQSPYDLVCRLLLEKKKK